MINTWSIALISAPEVLGPEKYDKSCDLLRHVASSRTSCCAATRHSTATMGRRFSPGMKLRIPARAVTASHCGVENVSVNAKDLIKRFLKTNPDHRLTIDQVMSHKWISMYTAAAADALSILPDPERGKGAVGGRAGGDVAGPGTMRIDEDQQIKLKTLKGQREQNSAQAKEGSAAKKALPPVGERRRLRGSGMMNNLPCELYRLSDSLNTIWSKFYSNFCK
uniref:Protein kinase domain-containing protein n=1 Tax=Macrostomum lignano TaxID=282301 RepID=A0A1I8IZH7_9PLAT